MSTYYKFRRQLTKKTLLSSVEGAGWKLSKMDDGTPALEKTSYVALDIKSSGKIAGFVRYGLNDCESLTYLAD